MRIDGVGPDSTRPAGSRSVEEVTKDEVRDRKSRSSRVGRDRVEISEAGRAAAANLAEAGAADAESLSVERVEAVRARIDAGLYDSPEVRQEVARHILESGDLDAPEPAADEG